MTQGILQTTKNGSGGQKPPSSSAQNGVAVSRTKVMGRPPHEPTDETRRMVEQHAAVGTRHEQIAKILGVAPNTMKKFYKAELTLGLSRANAVIASTLFAQAKGGNTTAMIFWLKTRGGWRETGKIEHAGTPGEPIEVR